jgi:hypothetical protein
MPSFYQVRLGTNTGKHSKRGTRFLTDPPESAPAAMRNPGQPTGGGYHVLDYTFFWANVRANVKERVDAFLLAKPKL